MASGLYIALLHTPVYNKRGEMITTSITNLDLHDISRVARTYGVKRYFLVHPQESQLELARDMLSYWRSGFGGSYNSDRKEALKVLDLAVDLKEVKERIIQMEGCSPLTIVTDARMFPQSISYLDLRSQIQDSAAPFLIMFGTGWGLTREVIEKADHILFPLESNGDYNHLSVRSAASIIMDRLAGEAWWEPS
ncbi:MAG: RNA methyltransferase [Syntrophomonadaceae bacterium]|nr:RNA methyltransferase [Syntrophomonadaceae bacterium]